MKATLTNYHQPPRKVRLVADLIRGKSVTAARAALSYLPKKSAPAVSKLLDSAIANARQANFSPEQLFIKKITVDKGLVMRRYRPFARGRAGSLRKAMSHVQLELAPLQSKNAKTKVQNVKKNVKSEKPKAGSKKLKKN